MRNLLIVFIIIPTLAWAQSKPDTVQKQVANRVNAKEQQKKPYVILISADGFRYDLADRYQATNIIKHRSEGLPPAL